MKVSRALHHVVPFAHMIWAQLLEPGDVVIDATMGNGNDTLFLCQLTGPQGHVYSIDIQASALVKTAEVLANHHINEGFTLIHGSHADLESMVDCAPHCVVFNLGYLPGSDKSLHTVYESTYAGVSAALRLLQPKGFVSITAYPGSNSGRLEADLLQQYLDQLPQEFFSVSKHHFTNQVNNPPFLYLIYKR